MIKINHAIYNNLEIEQYKAKFLTYATTGMGGEYKLFDTLEKAKNESSYGEIYIALPLKNK